jgi:putative intracellular protease/amidase
MFQRRPWLVGLALIAGVGALTACQSGDESGDTGDDQNVTAGSDSRPTKRFLRADGPKILVVTSSETQIDLKPADGKFLPSVSIPGSDTDKPADTYITGVFARELTGPLLALAEAGYSFDFASQDGITPTWDVNGLELPWFFWGDRDPLVLADDFIHAQQRRDQAVSLLQEAFGPLQYSAKRSSDELEKSKKRWDGWKPEARPKPRSLAEVASGIESSSYVGLVVPGGHAPMSDLAFNPDLGKIVQHFHDKKLPIGLVCHGPVALMSTLATTEQAKNVEGGWKFRTPADRARRVEDWHTMAGKVEWPFAGYTVTVESTAEEQVMEELFAGRRRVAYYVETEMARAGAALAPAKGIPVAFPGLVTRALDGILRSDPLQQLLNAGLPQTPVTITMQSFVNMATDENPELKAAIADENRQGRLWLPGLTAVTVHREVVTGANPGSAYCVGQMMDKIVRNPTKDLTSAVNCEAIRPSTMP